MDLSFLKWPIIIVVVVGGGWLLTSGGVNFMYNKFTATPPGSDAKQDVVDEAGLSKLGGYCLKTFQYEKAMRMFNTACDRFPQGANFYYNKYRMAKCAEKMEDYPQAVALLRGLMQVNASTIDDRVPINDNLKARSDKLEALDNA
jgi:tetratricopeptide (TPR) repeat protein